MQLYELTCLISPNISEQDLKSFEEKISALLQKEEGILVAEMQEKPIKKRLAYPVKKISHAYLVTFNLEINPEKIENIRQKLNSVEEILRYSIMAQRLPKIRKPSERFHKITKKVSQPKVELKEIEKKLEEILGE